MLAIIALQIISSACKAQEHSISIIAREHTQEPAPDLANHKDHDIVVYRTEEVHRPRYKTYTVYFYRKENDIETLRSWLGII